ncbi:MAG: CARDB domain-containing protein, partial [Methanobacteriota archaeon]
DAPAGTAGAARGWMLDDVKLVVRPSIDGPGAPEVVLYPAGGLRTADDLTGAGEAGSAWSAGPGWTLVDARATATTALASAGPPAWRLRDTEIDGERTRVWRFARSDGAAWGGTDAWGQTDARLVSPAIDLSAAAGRARLSFLHRVDLATNDTGDAASMGNQSIGIVEVSVFDPATGTFGPWEQLFDLPSGTPCRVGSGPDANGTTTCAGYNRRLDQRRPTGAGGYHLGVPFRTFGAEELRSLSLANGRPLAGSEHATVFGFGYSTGTYERAAFDLSPYSGEIVRVAFRGWARPGPPDPSRSGWWIADLSVDAEVLSGRPVDLRVRVGTDGSVDEGHLRVDSVGVVGTPYRFNLGIGVDGPSRLRAAPGTNVTITGTVANLGLSTRDSLELVGEPASLLGGSTTVLPSFVLRPAGSVGADRAPFELTVRVPPGRGNHTLTLRLLEAGAPVAGLGREEFLGNDVRTITIQAVEERRVAVDRFGARPNVVAAGVATTVEAVLADLGTTPESVQLRLHAKAPTAASATLVGEANLTLVPGGRGSVTFPFAPKETGLHELTLSVSGPTNETRRAVVAVGAVPTAFVEDAESNATTDRWTAARTPPSETAHAGEPGAPPNRATGREWHRTLEAFRGEASLLGGVESAAFRNGTSYPRHADAYVATPIVSLLEAPRPVETAGVAGASLSFAHRPRFAVGDGGVVEARIVDRYAPEDPLRSSFRFAGSDNFTNGWIRLVPDRGYGGATVDRPARVDASGRPLSLADLHPIPAPGGDRSAFDGFSDDWRSAVFDLASQTFPTDAVESGRGVARAGDPIPLLGERVQFRVRLGTREGTREPVNAPGQGWFVDDVSVSSSSALVTAPGAVPVPDNSAKRIHLRVENRGTFTEDFDLAYAAREAKGAERLFVRVPVPSVVIEPGASAVVPVEIAAPLDPQLASGPALLPIDVRSRANPLHLVRVDLAVDVVARAWADLAVELAAPPEFPERVPVLVSALVTNVGSNASKPVPVRFFAGTGDGAVVLGETTVPALAVGRDATVTFEATLPAGSAGPTVLRAVVDPDARAADLDRGNNEASRTVTVTRLVEADLAILPGDVSVLSAAGEPVSEVEGGTLVKVQAVVRNLGLRDATDASVQILVGSLPLKEAPVKVLGPGAETTVVATWIATPGNVTIEARVQSPPRVPEVSVGNNRAAARLLVRGFILDVVPVASSVPGSAGDAALLAARVTNRDRSVDRVAFSAEAGPLWTVEVEPPEALLAPEESTPVALTVRVPPGVTAGPHPVTLVARSTGLGRATSHTFEVVVAAERDLGIRFGPAALSGAGSALDAVLTNRGNGAVRAVVTGGGLEGWVVGPETVVVPAFGEARVRIPVAPRAGTAPGTYELGVTVSTAGAPDMTERVPVRVLPFGRARLSVDGLAERGA